MNLIELQRIFSNIGDDAIRILHRRIGKKKGLADVENGIRDEATKAAEKSFGGSLDRVAKMHIERYVEKRMDYMRNAFKRLKSPQTDTSKARGEFIGDTESKSAKEFGQAKGYERLARTKKRGIFKEWNTGDGENCSDCLANEDEGPIPVDEEFQSGDYAPQAHPGCDCFLTYSDEDGNEVDFDEEED